MYNLTDMKNTIATIATEAGNLLLEKRAAGTVTVSDWREFVTVADHAADELIMRRLKEAYPEIPVYSEESGGERTVDGWVFIVDAIDGTNNFAMGYGRWSVSIAAAKDGTTRLGVIRDAERAQTFFAVEGTDGAWCEAESGTVPLGTKMANDLRQSHVWTDWVKGDNSAVFTLLPKLKATTIYPRIAMCSTQTLMLVATGRLDGYVHTGPGPEDIAAAAYIVERAGGQVTKMDGSPWTPFGGSIVATAGGDFHQKLLAVIA